MQKEYFACADPAEKCWEIGEYADDCCCDLCGHRDECSGYDKNEDD